jgi:hypothetical protein
MKNQKSKLTKTNSHKNSKSTKPFFSKDNEGSFFSKGNFFGEGNFFKPTIQMKRNEELPEDVQTKMESSFGEDFSNVKIHKNSIQAKEINAHAFTQGNQIHFAPGKFNPKSKTGQELIGHELTHVVQQSQGIVSPTKEIKGMPVNDNKDLEKEADDMGKKAEQGKLVNKHANIVQSKQSQKSVIQGYFKDAGHRVADDISVATKDSNPWNRLYAKSGKVTASNTALKAVGASIELKETTNEKAFLKGTTSIKLKQVEIKNTKNSSEGDNMDLYADCGRSNSLIVGSLSRSASYKDKAGKSAQTTNTDPEMMKYEIMLDHFKNKIANASTILTTISAQIQSQKTASKALEPYTDKIVAYHKDLGTLKDDFLKEKSNFDAFMVTYNAATDEEKKKLEPKKAVFQLKVNSALAAQNKKLKEYQDYLSNTKDPVSNKSVKSILDEYFKEKKAYDALVATIMAPYNALSDSDRDSFDRKVGVNKYASPSVGSGYTISSGGDPYPNKSTWNFHWGGVVMESDDRKDKIVLENYSVSDWDAENKKWDLQMYGTQKKGQTFHEQHKGTEQHGKAPTTMNIKKQ